jgi:hypothetical protein
VAIHEPWRVAPLRSESTELPPGTGFAHVRKGRFMLSDQHLLRINELNSVDIQTDLGYMCGPLFDN